MRASASTRRFAEELARAHGIRHPGVVAALARVPRPLFVDEALRARAYSDDALPIGYGQTISRPSTVARMTEALEPEPDDRVLEIGTGSGYQTAVLSCLVARVYSVERIPALAVKARALLTRLGAFQAELRTGDGALGWPEEAPFQGILVTAAAAEIPRPLLEQLAIGGRLVLPLREGTGQRLRRIVRLTAEEWREEILDPCRFVPLVGGDGIGHR